MCKNVDKECLQCLRYHSKSCEGIEDRCREKITTKNSCSGFLHNTKTHSREELYKYLDSVDWNLKRETELSSVYFLVKFNNHIEPLYFMHYKNSYFESPCYLHSCDMGEYDLEEYVKDIYYPESFKEALAYEKTMKRENKHYEIDCPQCFPFLPEEVEIVGMISESECLDWLLEHQDL